MNAEVDVFPAVVCLLQQTDHGWKHIHLRIRMETGGGNCNLKELLMMGIIMTETC
jgi:hypothetical protein